MSYIEHDNLLLYHIIRLFIHFIAFPAAYERRNLCVAERPSRCVCVCVRRISLGGEGNALYPVLFSYYCQDTADFFGCLLLAGTTM